MKENQSVESKISVASLCNITVNGTVYHLHPNQPSSGSFSVYSQSFISNLTNKVTASEKTSNHVGLNYYI